MKTGSFAFAFTVTAAIQVIRNPGVRHGVALGKGRVKDRTHLRDGAHLQVGKVLGGFGRGMSARIARPAVDTVVVASALRPTDEPNQVVEIRLPAGGDPVLVGDGDDLHLFALDEGGSVLGWTLRADRAPGDPVQFGGSLTSLAAAGTTGGIRLFGVDDDHRLMTRSAADDEWSAIGDEITGTPALWVHEDWVSVVGRRDDGRVVHARLTAPDGAEPACVGRIWELRRTEPWSSRPRWTPGWSSGARRRIAAAHFCTGRATPIRIAGPSGSRFRHPDHDPPPTMIRGSTLDSSQLVGVVSCR